MCGIFGVINYETDLSYPRARLIRKVTTNLLRESVIRGSDASGVCVVTDEKARLFKHNVPSTLLVESDGYSRALSTIKHGKSLRAVIGHTRAQTKGDRRFNENNHPIVTGKVVGVHNGLISNDDSLFDIYSDDIKRIGRVDSEIIFQLLDHYIAEGADIDEAVKKVDNILVGSYTCAFIHAAHRRYVTIFTNSSNYSNLVLYVFDHVSTMVFASSVHIVERALLNNQILDPNNATSIVNLFCAGMRIDTESGYIYKFDLEDSCKTTPYEWSNLYREAAKKNNRKRRNKGWGKYWM